MIAEKEVVEKKPLEEKPLAVALMLPAAPLSTVLITYPMSVTLSLALLIPEVSLFVVGPILFA